MGDDRAEPVADCTLPRLAQARGGQFGPSRPETRAGACRTYPARSVGHTAMPRAKPVLLSQHDARRIWLAAQRLDVTAPFGAGPSAVADAVAHLGYVQIDTINVIERCHHHILYTRIPCYRRADLRQAQSAEKSVFEYWTHALSYVPSADFRYFAPLMREHRREGHRWYASVKPADTRKVMRLIKAGPLTIRDIEDDVLTEKEHLWQSRKPSKRALKPPFYTA